MSGRASWRSRADQDRNGGRRGTAHRTSRRRPTSAPWPTTWRSCRGRTTASRWSAATKWRARTRQKQRDGAPKAARLRRRPLQRGREIDPQDPTRPGVPARHSSVTSSARSDGARPLLHVGHQELDELVAVAVPPVLGDTSAGGARPSRRVPAQPSCRRPSYRPGAQPDVGDPALGAKCVRRASAPTAVSRYGRRRSSLSRASIRPCPSRRLSAS